MPVVFCKPDALYGPLSHVDGQRAAALLAALSAHCAEDSLDSIPDAWRPAAARAARQVAERSASESAFRGRLVEPLAAAARLRAVTTGVPAGRVDTHELLRWTVEGLGLRITHSVSLILGTAGVDAVYGGATATVEYEQVRQDLLRYLADEPIEVWHLSDGQPDCVLQWWKTYVRHVLLDREPGEYLLRNLVHACEGPDAAYLCSRSDG